MTDSLWSKGELINPAILLPQWDGETHKMPIRVYYEDTDAGGIVYHSNYVNYAERGRTEYLRALGFDQSKLTQELGILFAVKDMKINFRRPAQLDDLLLLSTKCIEKRGASFLMLQQIFKDQQLLVEMEVKIATISMELKPTRIPEIIDKAMLTHIDC